MIQITSLNKSYGHHHILKEISLNFHFGSIYGIVGENGAGKTTFFKCLAGLEDYSGSINYKGDGSNIKHEIGFLPAEPYFFSRMTGFEYLKLICNARKIYDVNIEERNIFDLPLNQFAENYSTGMKKKLAITGLLLQNNHIFILDEPFNGVDINSNLIIQHILQRLKMLNKIIIMSSHIFSTLSDSCDYIHYLKGGMIERTVEKDNFSQIEEKMKDETITSRIDKMLSFLT